MKTKSVKKNELNNMLKKSILMVENLGIELRGRINPNVRTYKATSYFGQLRYISEEQEFEITISEYHLKNGHDAIMETLVHEVLHACKGCVGHGKQWQAYANMVNRIYGYNITRLGSYNNGYRLPKKENKINYIVECIKCDNIFKRIRKSKLVTETYRYSCGSCGSSLIRTK